jgi:MFS family permease
MIQITNHPLYKKHDLDSAMNSFWQFYRSRFLTLFLTSFVMSVIFQYGSTFLNLKEIENIKDPLAMLERVKDFIVPMLIISVAGLLFSNILHYYILHNPIDNNKNILVSFLESLKYFLPYLIILIILAFFGTFAILLGLLAIFVGVIFSIIYLMMISFFILPVMMTEGINIGNTIVRTVRLSHRNFWNNIGWSSVFLILFIVVSLVLSSIIMIPFAGDFLKTIFNPQDAGKLQELTTNPVYIILSSAVNALTLPLIPIFGFIIYFNGRAREEVVHAPLYGDENYKVSVEDLYAKPIQEEKKEEREQS